MAPRLPPLHWPDNLLTRMSPQPNGCIWYTGAISPKGYGRITRHGKGVLAHVAAFEHFIGPVPDGLEIDHECHSFDPDCDGGDGCLHRRCVNPEHLAAVTHLENVKRSRVKWVRDTLSGMAKREADDPRKRTMCVRLTDSEWDELNDWVGDRNRSDVFRRILLPAARADASAGKD